MSSARKSPIMLIYIFVSPLSVFILQLEGYKEFGIQSNIYSRRDSVMENSPIMMPLDYVILLVVVPCIALVPSLTWDGMHWYREKNTNSRMTDTVLNMFRVLLYFFAVIYIIKGANCNPSIKYPSAWSQYLLVPIEYAATLPLLGIEGIGGAYNLLLKWVSYKWDDYTNQMQL